MPCGTIITHGAAAGPGGGDWLRCDGTAISRATYPLLFATLGVVFGPGDGVTTFNLPDTRGRFLLDASGSYAHGSTGGAATHTLTAGEMPVHTHDVNVGGNGQAPVAIAGGVVVTGVTTTSTAAGGGAAHNNMPPYLTTSQWIKVF